MLKGRRAHIIPIGLLLTVMLMVFGGGSVKGQLACGGANSQESNIDGICVLCSVSGAGNSVDANLTNFTQLNLGIGVGAVGYQRLIFPNTGISGDNVVIELETPVDLVTLTLLTAGTVQLKNGTAASGASYSFKSTSLSIQLLTSKRFKITIPAVADFDRIEVNFGGTLSAISSLKIYGAEILYQTPTVSAADHTICSGNTATLTATGSAGTTIKWYPTSSGGTGTIGSTFITPLLTSTTIYYVEASRACIKTNRLPVTVTVNPTPSAPAVASSTLAICSGSLAAMSVTSPVVGVTYNWYSVSTGGTILATGTSYSPSPTGSAVYYVEAVTSSGCPSTRTSVNVTVNPSPAVPNNITGTPTVCVGQTTTLANTTSGGTWSSSDPTIATVNGSGIVTGVAGGAATINYTVTNGTCTASASKVVTVNALPTITLGPTPNACIGTTNASLTYSATTGSPTSYSIAWSSGALANGFLPVANAILDTSPIVITIPATAIAATYQGNLTVKNSNNCIGSSITFNVIVHPKPATPSLTIE